MNRNRYSEENYSYKVGRMCLSYSVSTEKWNFLPEGLQNIEMRQKEMKVESSCTSARQGQASRKPC